MSDPYSEPLELFYNDEAAGDIAETAFDLAAKLYDLKAEKYRNKDYLIGYFRLNNPKTQLSRSPTLFKQGLNLIRMLTHYKKNRVSEPQQIHKVNVKDLKDALHVVNAFH
ncbi:MAG: hypothetical protein ACC656_06055 [Candidatus Heimdallarchaeota archaeon]